MRGREVRYGDGWDEPKREISRMRHEKVPFYRCGSSCNMRLS
jgi:hypothetical protein